MRSTRQLVEDFMGAKHARISVDDDRLAGDPRTPGSRRTLAPFLTLLLTGVAHAQIPAGELLLNMYTSGRIERFRPDGTHVWTSTGGTGSQWEGCSYTPQGRVVTTRRSPDHGVNVFDSNGAQVHSFTTPQVNFVPGDVSVFSDGTIAVTDQVGKVHLYTESGAFISTIVPAGSI